MPVQPDSQIRWGIIGFGDVVRRKSGPALIAEPSATVAAICRRRGDASEAARFFGCDAETGVERLVYRDDVDAIYIATPPDSHEALTIRALAAGKPIVVEKPIAPSAIAANRMIAAADEAGVSLSIAYYRRCLPRMRRIASLISAGAVGQVEAVEIAQLRADGAAPLAGWRSDERVSPGGRFSDSHIHALDWLRFAFGPHDLVAGSRDVDSGMVAYALRMAGAPVAGVFHPNADIAEDRLTIHGIDGRLDAPLFDPGEIVIQRDGGSFSQDLPDPKHPHQPFFAAMKNHILGRAPSPCPAKEAVGATEIVEKLLNAKRPAQTNSTAMAE